MFNLFHPERLVVVSGSTSQQICEEAVTGKNKGKEREHEERCREVQRPPRHFIMGGNQLAAAARHGRHAPSFISMDLKLDRRR